MQAKQKSQKYKRYAISVSGPTYERLRSSMEATVESTMESTSLQKFVDGILTSALDDPTILKRLSEKYWPKES